MIIYNGTADSIIASSTYSELSLVLNPIYYRPLDVSLSRDLARTRAACLLDNQPDNLMNISLTKAFFGKHLKEKC